MKLPRCLVFLLVLYQSLSVSETSHFRGATIQWSPVYSQTDGQFTGSVLITHQISWARNSNEGGHCNRAIIDSRQLLGGSINRLSCQSGCTGDIGTLDYFCTDFSELNNWSVGKRSYEYNARGLQVFEASFISCCWQALAIGGSSPGWELRVKFNLAQRPDTGRINISPSTVFFPDLQKQHLCNHTIQIPVFDVDGDVIRCRWAMNNECSDVCMGLPAELNTETCTIEFSATGTQGFYAVAIQVEDFVNASATQPLSSVPVQFLLEVVDYGLSCTDRVDFVRDTPAHGACLGVAVNQTLSGRITARDTEGHNITSIQTISPLGLRKSGLMTDNEQREWYVEFQWTPGPSERGPNLFCFTAHDSAGASSLQRCITLQAGATAPTVLTESLSPRGLVNKTDLMEWSVQFNTLFVRPSSSAFIHVFADGSGLVASIDVSRSDSVFYPESGEPPVLRFLTNFTVQEGSTYYVLLDPGVALLNDTCVTKSPPIESTMVWTVAVIVPDPCLDDPCDLNADCAQLNPLSRNFTCVCKPGFTGDGFVCIVPDPCLGDPCDVNADCVRQSLLNSLFNCTCREPFEGSGITCFIPDPCLRDPCDPNANCTQLNPLSTNFTCTCKPGFTGDGLTCIVPDPCLSDPCDINADCVRQSLLNSLFNCTCREPFEGSGITCFIPDPCFSEPCDINATCTREGLLNSNFMCSCEEPFTGNGFSCTVPDPCQSGPCHSNASCMREGLRSEGFHCECHAGYQGNGFNCTVAEAVQINNSREIIISVTLVVVVFSIFILIGAVYGYVRVVTRIVKSVKNNSDTTTLL